VNYLILNQYSDLFDPISRSMEVFMVTTSKPAARAGLDEFEDLLGTKDET
jgi:hypothetical protein